MASSRFSSHNRALFSAIFLPRMIPPVGSSMTAKADAKPGDVVLIIADKERVTLPVLGALRQNVAKKLDIIPYI